MTQQLNLGVSEALEIAEGSRSRLADAVLRECGRSLTEYVSAARTAEIPAAAATHVLNRSNRSRERWRSTRTAGRHSIGALQAVIAS